MAIPTVTPETIPNPIIPQPTPQETPPLLPPPEDLLRISPPTPTTPEPLLSIPGTIIVEKFEFEGNTAFSSAELSEALKEFIGKPITFAQLIKAEETVTNFYVNVGYINSGAVIPAGQILSKDKAVIKIKIVEGGLEDIKVIGLRRLSPSYVRSRLRLATAKPLNRNRLLEALQLLQLDPLIQNISASLSAGSHPELSLLEVRITEADSFNTVFFADNGRVPTVGSFRRGLRIVQGNLLGFGDGLGVVYTNTDGSNALDINYTIPFNSRNGTIRLAGGLTATNVIEPPFDRLDITGNSHYYELSVRQPVILTPRSELALGLTASRQESKTTLLGENFQLSPGADNEGRTRISSIRFFQEYTRRNAREVFAVRSQLSLGIDAFDATINEETPDSRFFSWRGQAQYVRLLAPDTLLVVRSDVQLADRALVPLEQFGLGGFGSVRGYRQDVLLTDNGVLTSAEVRLPIYRESRQQKVLQIVPFVDFGTAWNSSGRENPNSNTLLGVGVGLQLQLGDRFSARFDYGIPLIDIDTRKRTWQENGLYFSLEYNPF